MDNWNPNKYLLYSSERTQPAFDLVNKINIDNPSRIIDIGCGPGNSTSVLANKFSEAHIIGIDNSVNMIEAAKKNYPKIEFKVCDAQHGLLSNELLSEGLYDVVFSNACIQWIPNHQKLLRDMLLILRTSGVLAVQIPMNYEEPIHKIIQEIIKSDKWKSKFKNSRIFYSLSQGEYFDLLSDISSDFIMWETVYFHKLKSHDDIIEWYRTTGLRPYLDALSEADKIIFENEIKDRVIDNYPKQKNGKIIFKFPRLFFIAYK